MLISCYPILRTTEAMISSTIFFWVLPVMFAVFTAVFAALARSDGGSATARKGAAAFGIGALAIILDTQRQYFPGWFFTLAVPMHWIVLLYTANAFLARHGDSTPFKPAAAIFSIGLVINFGATFIIDNVAIRVPNTIIIATVLLALSLPKFYQRKQQKLDRIVAAAMTVFWLCYIIRLVVYFMMNQSNEYAQNSQWSQYMLMFYFTSGVAALSLAFLLIVTITKDVIERHHAENTRDALTGIANRRGFDKMVERQIAGSPAFGAVMMIDLDHFKQVNDVHGHAAGDEVLLATAQTLSLGCHGFGEAARMGGEEFAVLVRATHAEAALQLAELLRTSVAATRLPAPLDSISFTASIGVANIEPDESVSDAMRRADVALYKAKEAGRDRVAYARSGFSVSAAVAA
jgi:diguanylate cyclase (GGDEF)-like protein